MNEVGNPGNLGNWMLFKNYLIDGEVISMKLVGLQTTCDVWDQHLKERT